MNYRAVPSSLVHLSRKSLRLGYVPRYPAPAIMGGLPAAHGYRAAMPCAPWPARGSEL